MFSRVPLSSLTFSFLRRGLISKRCKDYTWLARGTHDATGWDLDMGFMTKGHAGDVWMTQRGSASQLHTYIAQCERERIQFPTHQPTMTQNTSTQPAPPHLHLRRKAPVPSLDPERHRDAHAHVPGDAPERRPPPVVLQEDVRDIVHQAAGHVPGAQTAQGPSRHARRRRRRDAPGVQAQALEAVCRCGLGALDAEDGLVRNVSLFVYLVKYLAACLVWGGKGGGGPWIGGGRPYKSRSWVFRN